MNHTFEADVWHLAPTVHAAAAHGDLVFLDVSRDAYSCLPGGSEVAAICSDGRGLRLSDPQLVADLTAAGLLQPLNEALPPTPLRLPRATSSALEDLAAPPQWRDFLEALGCLLDLFFHYQGRSFSMILASVTSTDSSDQPTAALLTIVRRFHRWSPILPVTGKCLLQSFMLRRLLHRSGHEAAWVFGVSTWPFRAHCWLQSGDVVLNDTVERVRAFEPIMVV